MSSVQRTSLINFPSLQNKLLRELNILEYLDARSYQLTLCITYYISKHSCACFLCCFGIIFSPLIVHEYKKIASVKSVIFFWIQYQLYSVGVIIFKDFASNTQSAALVLSGRRRLGAILSLRGLRRVTLSPSVGPRGPLWEELLLFVIKLEMEKWNKKGPREALLFFFKLELKKWSKT